ncbi:proline-rich transmembrane protein 4 [Chanos chanos]|uniref:Proline-rich transmembrane protein 4 n=1 Tax=Chanos chanos TaxID=29144 RepID=A0A6J2WRF3_CHACN|nr:proline-rich transmembrane protein 4-like [Chanos chanos]
MTPHSWMFVFVVCLSFVGIRHSVPLEKDGSTQPWTQTGTVAESSDQTPSTVSPTWTAWSTGAKMAVAASSLSNRLSVSDSTLSPEETAKTLKTVQATTISGSKSVSGTHGVRTAAESAVHVPRMEMFSSLQTTGQVFPPSTSTDGIPQESNGTELSDWPQRSRQEDPRSVSESPFQAALRPPPNMVPQDRTTVSPPPTVATTHLNSNAASPDPETAEPTFNTDQEVSRSTATGLRSDIRAATNATGWAGIRTDLVTAVSDSEKVPEGFTTRMTPERTVMADPVTVGRESGPQQNRTGSLSQGERDGHGESDDDGDGLQEEEESGPNTRSTVSSIKTSRTASPGSWSTEEWLDLQPTDSVSFTDCNLFADVSWGPTYPDNDLSSSSTAAADAPAPPLLVPLCADWNAAMATWGLAWELHTYGSGCVFALVAALSTLCLLALPFRWPSDCHLYALIHALQLVAGSSRALLLLYDPYGQRERLPVAWLWPLQEVLYPCLTGTMGLLLLLLLSARSSGQAVSQKTGLRRGCALLSVLPPLLLQVVVVTVSAVLLRLFPGLPVVPLIPDVTFSLLCLFLSLVYLLLYCYCRANATQVYRLNESSPERTSCQANWCPFTETGTWERATGAGVFSALFLLACGGLRLYAVLHALGVTPGRAVGMQPWAWWSYQLTCRVCEMGVCVTVSLITTHPILCCMAPPTLPKTSGWGALFSRTSSGDSASAKPHILPGGHGWPLRPAEKLALCESIVRRESESVPLYTLSEQPLHDLHGLDLHYPSSPRRPTHSAKKSRVVSQRSSYASLVGDSTVDLRPPSPIDLRRSIDEALYREALLPRSLFCSSRLSLTTRGPPDGQPCRRGSAESHLYRTASCGDMEPSSSASSSSLYGVFPKAQDRLPSNCCSGFGPGGQYQDNSLPRGAQLGQLPEKRYAALGSGSRENLPGEKQALSQAEELAVQVEFINVCRQIDALSISSDTIDL